MEVNGWETCILWPKLKQAGSSCIYWRHWCSSNIRGWPVDVVHWRQTHDGPWENLNKAGVGIGEERDTAQFLGVKLTKTLGGSMVLKRAALVNSLKLWVWMWYRVLQSQPHCLKPLMTKDVDGDPCSESFAHAHIIGMLICLSGHSYPEIVHSVRLRQALPRSCPQVDWQVLAWDN